MATLGQNIIEYSL